MAESLLGRGLAEIRQHGLPGDDAAWSRLRARLERYLQEIELWNPRLGLVEAQGQDLVVKHILDCLAALPLLFSLLESVQPDQICAMADIGSGAGLPGIPLLLAVECLLPQRALNFSMTLVEKQQRRIGFLLNVKAILGLSSLVLRQEKVEDVATAGEKFNLVSARAFSPLEPTSLSTLSSILAPQGLLFLYKGRWSKIAEELKASAVEPVVVANPKLTDWKRLSGNMALVVPIQVPFLAEERHMVIIPLGAGVC